MHVSIDNTRSHLLKNRKVDIYVQSNAIFDQVELQQLPTASAFKGVEIGGY